MSFCRLWGVDGCYTWKWINSISLRTHTIPFGVFNLSISNLNLSIKTLQIKKWSPYLRSITCNAYINERTNCDFFICLGMYIGMEGFCIIGQSCIIDQSLAVWREFGDGSKMVPCWKVGESAGFRHFTVEFQTFTGYRHDLYLPMPIHTGGGEFGCWSSKVSHWLMKLIIVTF